MPENKKFNPSQQETASKDTEGSLRNFKDAFEDFEAQYDKYDDLGSVSMDAWVRDNGNMLISALEDNVLKDKLRSCIAQGDIGGVFETVQKILDLETQEKE